jgi:hypothetical protein
MKKQTLKAIGIVFIGLLIWIAFIYLGIAFIKVEANPFMWSERARGVMFLTNFMYLAGIPLFMHELKDWL